jgi:DNA invertase Pin-like site-specific DNA recombinase
MSSRCVVYMRVSSPSQSVNSSFERQLRACTRAADLLGFYIKGIYADTCPGDGNMPNRSLAYLAAKQLDCPILVETQCRWSRMSPGKDSLVDVEVLVIGALEHGKPLICQRIYREQMTLLSFAT